MKAIFAIIVSTIKRKPHLIPPIIVLCILALIAWAAGNPVVAPFLYTIF